MQVQPLVSIIMATYNAENVLKEAFESIIANVPANIELIVIDGKSTDGTTGILKLYNKHISTWQSETDKGIYDALNKGVALAKGRWLYFMGADDRLLKGFKEMCALLKDDNTLYYGDVLTETAIFSGYFSNYRLAKYCINHQTIFYPAAIFHKHSYNIKYNVYADYALNIACWGDKSTRKKYYPIKVAWYNLNGHSSTSSDNLFKEDKPLLIKNSMGWLMYFRFLYKRWKEQRKPGSNFY